MKCTSRDVYVGDKALHIKCTSRDVYVGDRALHMKCTSRDVYVGDRALHMKCTSSWLGTRTLYEVHLQLVRDNMKCTSSCDGDMKCTSSWLGTWNSIRSAPPAVLGTGHSI